MNISRSQGKLPNQLSNDHPIKTINCLLTGFDPFDIYSHNPSAAVAQLIPASIKLKDPQCLISVTTLVLPVAGAKAWIKLKKAIDDLPSKEPSVVILLGLASGRKMISLERFALNIRDYRIKDNAGDCINGIKIAAKAPEAFRTKVPIEEVSKFLNLKGFPVEISNFAGSFICNETYFRALHYVHERELPHFVSFIHLPSLKDYGKALKGKGSKKWWHLAIGKENQLKAMLTAVKYIVEYDCEFLVNRQKSTKKELTNKTVKNSRKVKNG